MAALLLDALEDTAMGWTEEMRLASSASSLVSFFCSSLSSSFYFSMAAATCPLIFFYQGFFLPYELRFPPLSLFLWWHPLFPFLGGRISKSSSLQTSLIWEKSGGLWYQSSTPVFGPVPTLKFPSRPDIWEFFRFLDTLAATGHAGRRWSTTNTKSANITLASFETTATLAQILGLVQPSIE